MDFQNQIICKFNSKKDFRRYHMKLFVKILIILLSAGLVIYNADDMGAFGEEFITTVVIFILISTLLIWRISKMDIPNQNIQPVPKSNIFDSMVIFLAGLSTFLLFWDIRVGMNPMAGMINDFMLFWLGFSIILFVFPAQYLASYLFECSNSKGRRIIWFPGMLCGGYLYMGFVLSGVLG